jgi:hypothetical protein
VDSGASPQSVPMENFRSRLVVGLPNHSGHQGDPRNQRETPITDHSDGASRSAASTGREETTLYAVVSNPTDAFSVRPKYGLAGEPIPPEYWQSRKWHRRLRRFLRRQLSRARATFTGNGHDVKS